MQLARTVARNSAVTMAAQIAIKLLSFIFTVLIVRRLGASDYGQYAAVAAFGSMFLFVGDLGLSPYLVRELARLRDKPDGHEQVRRLYGTVLWLKLGLSLVGVCLMLVVAWLTGRPLVMIGALALNALGMLLYAVQGTSDAVLAGYERLDLSAGAKVAYQIAFVTLGGAVLFMGLGYYGLIYATLAAIVLLTALCWRVTTRLGVLPARPEWARWPILVRAALPFGVVAFALGLSYRFDSVLLNIFHGDAVTGYYNAAYNLVFSTAFLSNAINSALYPSLSRQAANDPASVPKVYGRVIRYLLLIGLPIAVGASFLADRLIPFLFDAGYEPSIQALRIVIWVVPLMFISEFLGYAVIIGGHERRVARSVLLSTGLNVAINLALVPRYGLLAAATMTVVTEMVLVGQYLWILRAQLTHVEWGHALVRPAAAALLMGCVVLLLHDLPVLACVAAGVITYGVLLLALGVVGPEEWRFVRGLRRAAPTVEGGAA
ncbi:MAG: flippase [Chloroflexales bacterium]|nr:flippase [Chloroflexales bacterium]